MAELIVKLDLNDIKELIVAHLNEVYQLDNAKVEDIEIDFDPEQIEDTHSDEKKIKALNAIYHHTS